MTRPQVAIIEDDDILSFLLTEICTAAGWQVVGTARSADEGLRLVGEHSPDVLILDFALEGEQDGMEVLDGVKSQHPATKTILVTGWDYEKLRQRIDFIEPDHMLRKPVMPDRLTALLARLRQQIGASHLPHAA